jgi:hypothetical protein
MLTRALALTTILVSALSCDSYGSGSGTYGTSPSGSGATKLAFAVQPSNVTAGAVITPAVQVAIQNTNGVTVTSSTAAVTIEITPGTGTTGATLGGTVTRAAVSGIATFNNLTITPSGTGYSFTATSSGLTSAASTLFAVTP